MVDRGQGDPDRALIAAAAAAVVAVPVVTVGLLLRRRPQDLDRIRHLPIAVAHRYHLTAVARRCHRHEDRIREDLIGKTVVEITGTRTGRRMEERERDLRVEAGVEVLRIVDSEAEAEVGV